MPNEARIWIDALLQRHALNQPDQRPLYAYRCTEADYASLAELTGPVLDRAIKQGCLRDAPGALFCLFAAEWIRRRYSGGQLRYADILSATHAPDLAYPVLQDLVQRGLRFWHRPLLRVGQARIFLLTLACEGGLPMQFLQHEGAALRRYFRNLLKDVQTYRFAGIDSATLAAQAAAYLPKSLRQDVVYELAAQIVDAVWALQQQVVSQSDPIATLNHIQPRWRDQFPLELSDLTAQSFLEGLVSTAAGLAQTGKGRFQLLRTLVNRGAGWQLRAEVDLPGLLPRQDACAAFGGEPNGRLELLLRNSQTAPVVLGWATPCQTGVLLERSKRVTTWTGVQASASFQLSTRPQISSSALVPLQGGEPLEDLPWIFVDADGSGHELRFRGQGSIKTRYPMAWIAVPRAASLHAEGDTEVEVIGELSELGRTLFRVVGQVRVVSDRDDQCSVVTRSDAAEEDSFQLHGKLLTIARASVSQYLGVPKLFAISEEGSIRPVSPQHLHWRSLVGAAQNWRALSADCIGDGELRYVEQGKLRFRTRIGILPESLSLSYEPRMTANGGCVRVNGPSALVGVIDTPITVDWKRIETPGQSGTLIDMRCSGEPPESVTLSIRWPSGGESRLTVPFPAGGQRFLDPSGKVLSQGALVPWDRLSGVRARVMSPLGGGRYILTGALNASDLSPDLAHAVWVRAPIPQVVGTSGRINEIDLLELQDDLLSMLSASKDLDAFITLRIESPSINNTPGSIRVGRYDLALEPTPDRRAVRLDTASLARINGEPLGKLRVEIFPLWAPANGHRELQPSLSEGVPTGEWSIEEHRLEDGPWMVTAWDGDWNRTRPLLITVDSEIAPSVDEENHLETLAGRNLRGAIRLSDPLLRVAVLKKSVRTLRDDCLSPDWELALTLIHAFSDLPPSSMDLLPQLVGEPEAVVMTLLKENPADVPGLLALFERLPFSWRLLPIRAWLQAIRRHVSALRDQLQQLTDCDVLIWNSISAVLGKAGEQYPYLDVVRELVCWDVHGWLKKGETKDLGVASTAQGRVLLRQCLLQVHQELLHAKVDDNNWPQGPALSTWVEQQIQAHPVSAQLIVDTPHGTGYRKPVQNAPIAAAMVSAYGLTAPPRVVYEIASLRTFDKCWFDKAYRLALTLLLGHMLVHSPDCWEG